MSVAAPGVPAVRFEPDEGQVHAFDRRMRERLADSVSYAASVASGRVPFDATALDEALDRVRRERQHPLVFGAYHELIVALETGELGAAAERFTELATLRDPDPEPIVFFRLEDRDICPDSARYARFFNNDPTAPFAIAPAAREQVARFEARTREALGVMRTIDPALHDEVHALVQVIVLAACPPDHAGSLIFDGASAFALWGAILLNVDSHVDLPALYGAIAHEAAHNWLFGFCADGPLVENRPDERYPSPLRADPRPMDGIVHATFVSARMHLALERLAAGVADDATRELAIAQRDEAYGAYVRGTDVIRSDARLSDRGRHAMAIAADYLRSI